ncbi:hypothetical protein [Paraburkholderia sediminicola]|uniref:hypothetical protein n=1 Tax=Paraburkholderia sediminicola TaxID=458836 RepID=UPI000EADBC62
MESRTRNVLNRLHHSPIVLQGESPTNTRDPQRLPKLQATSPYTIKNLDAAIVHLEITIAAERKTPVLGANYWRSRMQEVRSTPDILPAQLRRLQHLLVRLKDLPPEMTTSRQRRPDPPQSNRSDEPVRIKTAAAS